MTFIIQVWHIIIIIIITEIVHRVQNKNMQNQKLKKTITCTDTQMS